jgi:FkbM family methyltransferase
MAPISRLQPAPWHFRFAKSLIRSGVRGPGLWLRAAQKLGLLNQGATYQLTDSLLVDVPIFRMETMWDEEETRSYERELLDSVASSASRLTGPLTLIDCGADIGLFSLGMLARLPSLKQIVAFEPNEIAYPWLKRNLDRLSIKTWAAPCAAGDRAGKVQLSSPTYDPSDHARFAQPSDHGTIEMIRPDDTDWSGHNMEAPRGLILKVDVEGGELAVLRGCENLLRTVDQLLVVIEMHPKVLARTNTTPQATIDFLASLHRPLLLGWAEVPSQQVVDDPDPLMAVWDGKAPKHLLALTH